MIAHIKGTLEQKDSTEVVVDVNGVGYSVEVAERTLNELPAIGEPITFYTYYSHNRENIIKIYGFTSRDALKMFECAITVERVGPSLAQSIVTRLSPAQFQQAVLKENIPVLTRVPRLSEEIAKRIILKLKKKIANVKLEERVDAGESSIQQTVIEALVNLGASDLEAEQALKKAVDSLGDSTDRDALVKEALRYIRN